MSYLGDFAAGDIIDFKFTTRQSSGLPTNLSSGAIAVYKSNSTTESTTGVTLSGSPFDGIAGLNHVRIDTSQDGTFYADGSQFEAVITAGTVNSVSVIGECVGRFTLRAQASLYPTTAGRKLDVSTGGEAGVDWANVGSPTTTLVLSGTTIKTATDVETDTQDIQSRLPAALVSGRMDASVGAYQTGLTPLQPTIAGRTLDVTATGGAGIDWANVENQTTVVGLSGTTIKDATDVETAIAAVQADTNDIQTRLPAALISGRMDSTVGAYQSGLTPLQPTVSGRTLDVSAGGEAGVDWANVGSPTSTVGLSGTTVGAVTSATLAAGQLFVKKNTTLAAFQFVMFDSAGIPTEGLTVSATRSIDGGAEAACANAVTGGTNGIYAITLDASDLNGTTIMCRFAATGAADTFAEFITQS